MRYLALGFALILAACTGTTATTQPADGSTTSTTTVVTVPGTTSPPESSTTTTTSPPVPAPPIDLSAAFTPLPIPDEELPHMLGDALIGENGLLYSGAVSPTPRDHPNEAAFWHYDGDTWARTLGSDIAPPDQYGLHPTFSNLVIWEGQYLGFVSEDGDDPDALPSLVRSDDGRSWSIEPVFPRAAAGSSLGGIFPTPESPPWPGAAGVSGITTIDDEIVAVGWVAISESESAPTVWRSVDGLSWTISALPNANWPNEWAAQISIGESGWLISGAGPVHGAGLLWFSPDGDAWTHIGDAFQQDDEAAWWSFGELASGAEGLVVNTVDLSGETSEQLWRSDDGLTWTTVGDRSPAYTSLISDGSTVTRMIRGAATTVVDSSVDGETWQRKAELPIETDIEQIWFHLGLLGGTVTITELTTTEDYTGGSAALWVDAPVAGVVLVEADDTLNIRDGVLAEVVGELGATATGIQTTGATDGAAGSLWAEIFHNGHPGWVNSFYLTESVDGFAALEPLVALEDFAQGVFRESDPLGQYVGSKGVSVVHFDETKWFARDADPMSDQTIYVWGSPGCGVDPDCAFQEMFSERIAAGFLSAWDDADRVVELDTPIAGGNGTPAEFVIPVPFRNFHYVTVHDPGDNPDFGGLDWVTWYVYFDMVDGAPVVAGISVDMWAP